MKSTKQVLTYLVMLTSMVVLSAPNKVFAEEDFEFPVKKQIESVKSVLSAKRKDEESIVFFPNPPFEQAFGHIDHDDYGYYIGKYNTVDISNKFVKDTNFDFALMSSKMLISTNGVAALPSLPKLNIRKNPWRVTGLKGEFGLGPIPVGRALVLKRLGYYPLDQRNLINHKPTSSKVFGNVRFDTNREMLILKGLGYRNEAFQKIVQTYGFACNGFGCQPLQEEVNQKVREAGYYEEPVTQWIDKKQAHVMFKDDLSPIRLQAPENGKLYITDLLVVSPDTSFGWNEKQCKNRVKNKGDVSGDTLYMGDGHKFKECPLYGFNYKIIKGTEFIDKLKTGLLEVGWPKDMVNSITYLPMQEIKP